MASQPIQSAPQLKVALYILFLIISSVYANEANSNENMIGIATEQRKEFSRSLANFAVKIYNKLSLQKPNENIVFSPFSIQTCIAMARVGAEGETAAELDSGLGLVSSDVNVMADTFSSVLATYEKSDILKIANKIYVMEGYTVQDDFNEILSQKFFSTAEEIDFSKNTNAAKAINAWVESRTNNLIRDLIPSNALNSYTRLVLLNAIHFKGEWRYQFNKEDTQDEDFYINESESRKVSMMRLKERFRYAKLPELDAAALEMPYKNSDLSMLIILPNSRTGLSSLESKLKEVSIADITGRMTSTQVIVKLPRFKAEFSVELNEPLKQLGMTRMFSKDAEFGNMLKSPESLQVSKVIHKAFIEVNEEGTEAAAATAMLMRKKRCLMPAPDPKEFIVEHPFLYVISHEMPDRTAGGDNGNMGVQFSLPLFMGSVASLEGTGDMHDEL